MSSRPSIVASIPRLSWVAAAALFAAVGMLMVPATPSHGADGDAYRIAEASLDWLEGNPACSRAPCYPVSELAFGLAVPAGPAWTVLLAAVFGAVFLLLFGATLQATGRSRPGARTLVLAALPMVWLAASMTMDYIVALAFAWAAFAVTATARGRTRRVVLGALLFGLAVGARPATVLLIPVYLAVLTPRDARTVGAMLAGAAASALPWVPVLATQGIGGITHLSSHDAWNVARAIREAGGVFGTLGMIAIPVGAVWVAIRMRNPGCRRDVFADPVAWAAGCSAVLVAVSFLSLPHEPFYLLPVLPLLASMPKQGPGRQTMRWAAVIAITATLLPAGLGLLAPAGSPSVLEWHIEHREQFGDQCTRAASLDLPPDAVLFAAGFEGCIRVAQRAGDDGGVMFHVVDVPVRSDVEAWVAAGRPLFVLAVAEASVARRADLDGIDGLVITTVA